VCPTSNKTLLSSETHTQTHTQMWLGLIEALTRKISTSCEKLFKKAFDIITPTSKEAPT